MSILSIVILIFIIMESPMWLSFILAGQSVGKWRGRIQRLP